jgi:hypothetical protein
MPDTESDEELRTKAKQVLDRMAIPGSLPEAVSDLLDAIVADMRQAAAQAASDARERLAAEDRLAKIEHQVQLLTATVNTISHSMANAAQRQALTDPQSTKPRTDA